MPRLLSAEELDGFYRSLFQISERDDVSERLGGIINAIGAREGLDQAVIT